MISTAAELATALVKELPPDVRSIMEAHFFDGESLFKIQRRHKVKRRDMEAITATALVTMRKAMRSRGVQGVADFDLALRFEAFPPDHVGIQELP